MTKDASITQTCNIPPKRLIHLLIFILLSLKCYQTEDQFKLCWTTRNDHRYIHTISTQIIHLQECKDYCAHEVPECNLVVFDRPSTSIKCYYKNSSIPLNGSYIQHFPRVNTYVLDVDCAKNVPSCWTVIGDHKTRTMVQNINRPNGTLESCKQMCIHEYSHVCNMILYNDIELGGRGCWIEREWSRSNLYHSEGSTTYQLNRTCLAYTTLPPVTTSTSVTTETTDSITSCWTVKGDHNFRGLHLKSKPNMNLLTCKNICIHENPDCDVINYLKLPDGKIECWVKTQAGPLDKFFPMLGITSYILNRTCFALSEETHSIPPTTTMPYTATHWFFKLDIKSFFDKYYFYILIAVGIFLLFAVTGCGMAFCKQSDSLSEASTRT